MTKITTTQGPWEVGVEVLDGGRRRALVVSIDPYQVHVRQRGRRAGYSLPWGAVYQLGVRALAEARANRREMRAPRKAGGR